MEYDLQTYLLPQLAAVIMLVAAGSSVFWIFCKIDRVRVHTIDQSQELLDHGQDLGITGEANFLKITGDTTVILKHNTIYFTI